MLWLYNNTMNKIIFGLIILVMTSNCSAFNVGLSGASFTGNDAIKVANAVKNAKLLTNEGVKEEMIVKTKTILRKVRHQ
jgi:hypothetical protein|tara:strand:- start:1122 stop:1358 length:237 start_codon:yes stop_codon:yes gene_type:complete